MKEYLRVYAEAQSVYTSCASVHHNLPPEAERLPMCGEWSGNGYC